MNKFILKTKFQPAGDQPQAIKKLVSGLQKDYRAQTLLGVTGSGKTFTMANVIAQINRPTLVISHNKTLAAQLYGEFRQFFPENAVHYFVSYYDYYQPEAYIPQSDTYIEKEATINEEIDRLRHAATQSLVNRRDVLIVASVSCIYGIGEKDDYIALSKTFRVGEKIKRNELLRQLVKIQYERNDTAFYRGQFKVRGETIDIYLSTGESVVRIMMFGDQIGKIMLFATGIDERAYAPTLIECSTKRKAPDKKTTKGQAFWAHDLKTGAAATLEEIIILPAKHFMTPDNRMKNALKAIRRELKERLAYLTKHNHPIEAYRLEKKTNFDAEMIEQVGYCNGIENYSRHLTGRASGLPPSTLIDFFPKDFLLIVDESHATLPQVKGMFAGDRSRKQTLIDFGFRLPSALDNRPLNFAEFNDKIKQTVYMSATPAEYEIKQSRQVVKQIVRPTGLLDPAIAIRPTAGQIADLIAEISLRVAKKQRTLVTTLTKRMAEELAEYLAEEHIKVQYIHSEVGTFERVEILRDLRSGIYDVLIGVNLLREGLDLPEVSLVAILDADIGGFLRTETSLMQTMGRAARHAEGKVIMYADKITPAMRSAIAETRQRRRAQEAYNKKHAIIPRTIKSDLHKSIV